jgi:hypothetical protein
MIKQSGRSIKHVVDRFQSLNQQLKSGEPKAGGSIKESKRRIIPHTAKAGEKSA